MTKNKDRALGLLAGLGLVGLTFSLLTGCTPPAHSDEPAPPPGPPLQQVWKTLDDGRQVTCLYAEGHVNGYSNGTSPALSCDWATTSRPTNLQK